MTSGSLSLSLTGIAFRHSLNRSFSWSFAIPDEQQIFNGPEGSSLVVTQKAGEISAALHVPIFGQIWSISKSEAGTYAISETIDGVTVGGSLYLA